MLTRVIGTLTEFLPERECAMGLVAQGLMNALYERRVNLLTCIPADRSL